MAEISNLLLDTHVLLWWLGGSNRLSQAARKTIVESSAVYVSAASVWEIGIKVSKGKLNFGGDMEAQLLENGFRPLPVSISHALAAGALPPHHGDPFDRMLIAQARLESLTLLTSDSRLGAYGAPVLLV
jgi:PIN domain nuclease of toxin-antitoxin system